MRLFTAFLVTSLSLPAYSVEAPTVPDKAERCYQTAESSFIKQYHSEMGKLIKDLEKMKSDETKAGNLEAAFAIVNLLKEVKAGKLLMDAMPADSPDSKQSTQVDNPEAYLVGTWTREDKRCSFAFFKDGNVHISWGDKPWKSGDKPDAVGTWELDKSDSIIRITYCGEYSDISLPLTDGKNKITDKNHSETSIVKRASDAEISK